MSVDVELVQHLSRVALSGVFKNAGDTGLGARFSEKKFRT
jgi:hypothetical protein